MQHRTLPPDNVARLLALLNRTEAEGLEKAVSQALGIYADGLHAKAPTQSDLREELRTLTHALKRKLPSDQKIAAAVTAL